MAANSVSLLLAFVTCVFISSVVNPTAGLPQQPAVNDGKPEFVQVDSIVSDNCLGCICEGSTGCDVSQTCSGGGFCGPFLISRAYWVDAGQPVLQGQNPNAAGAFESCVQDTYCAAQTIRYYMKKFQQDCNGDGVIDCEDFVRIHKNGGYSCSQPLEGTKYYQQFSQCKNLIPVTN